MGFEFFTQSGRGFRPRASIRKQGQIGLTQGAVRRWELKEWKYVVLGYDRENKLVGLRLTNDENERGAQKMVIKDGSASISARSFLEFFAISYRDETRQYNVSFDEADCMLVVSIGEAVKNGDPQGGRIEE